MKQRVKGKILKAGFEAGGGSGLGVFRCYCFWFGGLGFKINRSILMRIPTGLGTIFPSKNNTGR